MDKWIKIITVLVAVIGAFFGIVQYFDTKNQEFEKRIWEERKLLYYEVTDYTSKIAISSNTDTVSNEIKGFWSMYYGRLPIIEDASVYFAMINYGEELKRVVDENIMPYKSKLPRLSFQLALACRTSLQETWEPVKLEDLGELDDNQNVKEH